MAKLKGRAGGNRHGLNAMVSRQENVAHIQCQRLRRKRSPPPSAREAGT
jgi:hypothetical protein